MRPAAQDSLPRELTFLVVCGFHMLALLVLPQGDGWKWVELCVQNPVWWGDR